MTAFDICNSAITYQLFEENLQQDQLIMSDGGYSRHRMGNVIRHDSRVDHIEKILQLT